MYWGNQRLAFGHLYHYSDVIMGEMVYQITDVTIVYSAVFSGADQINHQSSASLAFVRGIPRTKGQWRRKWFHLKTSSWSFSNDTHPPLCLLVTSKIIPVKRNTIPIQKNAHITRRGTIQSLWVVCFCSTTTGAEELGADMVKNGNV